MLLLRLALVVSLQVVAISHLQLQSPADLQLQSEDSENVMKRSFSLNPR